MMEKMKLFVTKLHRRWVHMRLRPIHVYCLHHVCERFESDSMNEGDWMQIDEFQSKVLAMQQSKVEFISLKDAYEHICKDWFRQKNYAVLTFDDGYASLKEILPWLEEQNIPCTLFINGKYLDGQSFRKNAKERYLTYEELFSLTIPLVEVGSHGWEHIDATTQTDDAFLYSLRSNIEELQVHPRYVSFHAYTYGRHTKRNDDQLKELDVIPVLIDGQKNYNERDCIHRELLN